ncbi:hypothetical protein [Prauserella endophytica]|uniref:PH domain-containing protein n=1 Tax=Prauserella endophytica TaxID=1592324 RepID=A0ABY2RXP8_9PSEU|nr:hypothetical protein [Prauserella endophytica]TKG64251.1 hypothetical protein FCN18_28985 [Prauserella endophytica]
MQSSEPVPLPGGWQQRRTWPLALNTAFLAVLAILLILLGIGLRARGDDGGRGTYFLVGGLFMGGIALSSGLVSLHRWRRAAEQSQVTQTDGALRVPYRSQAFAGYLLLPFVGLVPFGLLFIGFVAALTDGDLDGTGVVVGLVSTAMVALALWWTVELVRGAFRRGALTLSPKGVRHEGWTFDSFSTWEDIRAVRADNTAGPSVRLSTDAGRALWSSAELRGAIADLRSAGPVDPALHALSRREQVPGHARIRRRTSRALPAPEFDDGRDIVLPVRWFAVDPVLLYRLVRFYAETPSARPELATGAAAQRLRSDRLPMM